MEGFIFRLSFFGGGGFISDQYSVAALLLIISATQLMTVPRKLSVIILKHVLSRLWDVATGDRIISHEF